MIRPRPGPRRLTARVLWLVIAAVPAGALGQGAASQDAMGQGAAGQDAAGQAPAASGPSAQAQTTPAPEGPGAPGFDSAAQAPASPVGPLPRAPVLIVNRTAVVENSAPALALRDTERTVRETVQRELDTVKAELEAEEQTLTTLKETMDPAEFAERARQFDRRVKEERRDAQERGAALIRFVQEARAALVSALPRVLEALRREAGALVILDSAAIAVADPGLDVTDEAIERYNIEMGDVRFDPPAGVMRE